jgi:hypothetical protein
MIKQYVTSKELKLIIGISTISLCFCMLLSFLFIMGFDIEIQTNMTFNSLQDRYTYIMTCLQKIENEDVMSHLMRKRRIRLLYKAMPSDFTTFYKIAGGDFIECYIMSSELHYAKNTNPWSEIKEILDEKILLQDDLSLCLELFRKHLTKEVYIKKLISICIGGFWNADTIGTLAYYMRELIKDFSKKNNLFFFAITF